MKFFWKSAAALALAVASLGAVTAPAQAQDRGGHSWRGDRDRDGRWNDRRRDNRRWDDRRHWRGDRRDWRGHRGYDRPRYGYRQRCWTEWRYDHYRDRRVRARVCR
ncbi:hypothetical protein MOK15_14720 [Sphingobium sp. BYY-5]|uniref:hypothetical protein n=1 Tax=Sphingobium sp. BYY-5 TaxID=2926400 RepID=UPI001FA6F146|nr:hypothetical protein [Sphingobium sp. BYY-5]MCI4591339.1 hypothetical protein [Sphingobium sp. BYY-5]